MSPRQLMASHTYPELYDWMAFFRLEEADHKQAADQARLNARAFRARGGR